MMESVPGDVLIVYATSPGQVADDGDGQNSPFTTALLEHMGTRSVEVQIMLKRVIAGVEQKTGGRQRPWQNASLAKEVYLAGSAPDSVPASQSVPESPDPIQISGLPEGVSSEPSSIRNVPGGARARSDAELRPLYKKWWFWSVLDSAAAAAVGVGLGVGLSAARPDVSDATATRPFSN